MLLLFSYGEMGRVSYLWDELDGQVSCIQHQRYSCSADEATGAMRVEMLGPEREPPWVRCVLGLVDVKRMCGCSKDRDGESERETRQGQDSET